MKTSSHFEPHCERRYPVLTAIDLMLHWTISGAVVALVVIAFVVCVLTLAPLARPL